MLQRIHSECNKCYCMLNGPCEHPELLVNTTFDNKTNCNEGQI